MINGGKFFIACLSINVILGTALAQNNSTVIGGDSLAKDCYLISQQATLRQSATQSDLQVCDRAIFAGGLKKENLAATFSNRGVVRMAMQDYKGAYRDYQKAIELDNDLADAYINRGNLWFVLQQLDRAIADYNQALQMDSGQQAVLFLNRGLAYERLGDFQRAKTDYLAALDAKPEWQAAEDKLTQLIKKMNKDDGRKSVSE